MCSCKRTFQQLKKEYAVLKKKLEAYFQVHMWIYTNLSLRLIDGKGREEMKMKIKTLFNKVRSVAAEKCENHLNYFLEIKILKISMYFSAL